MRACVLAFRSPAYTHTQGIHMCVNANPVWCTIASHIAYRMRACVCVHSLTTQCRHNYSIKCQLLVHIKSHMCEPRRCDACACDRAFVRSPLRRRSRSVSHRRRRVASAHRRRRRHTKTVVQTNDCLMYIQLACVQRRALVACVG